MLAHDFLKASQKKTGMAPAPSYLDEVKPDALVTNMVSPEETPKQKLPESHTTGTPRKTVQQLLDSRDKPPVSWATGQMTSSDHQPPEKRARPEIAMTTAMESSDAQPTTFDNSSVSLPSIGSQDEERERQKLSIIEPVFPPNVTIQPNGVPSQSVAELLPRDPTTSTLQFQQNPQHVVKQEENPPATVVTTIGSSTVPEHMEISEPQAAAIVATTPIITTNQIQASQIMAPIGNHPPPNITVTQNIKMDMKEAILVDSLQTLNNPANFTATSLRQIPDKLGPEFWKVGPISEVPFSITQDDLSDLKLPFVNLISGDGEKTVANSDLPVLNSLSPMQEVASEMPEQTSQQRERTVSNSEASLHQIQKPSRHNTRSSAATSSSSQSAVLKEELMKQQVMEMLQPKITQLVSHVVSEMVRGSEKEDTDRASSTTADQSPVLNSPIKVEGEVQPVTKIPASQSSVSNINSTLTNISQALASSIPPVVPVASNPLQTPVNNTSTANSAMPNVAASSAVYLPLNAAVTPAPPASVDLPFLPLTSAVTTPVVSATSILSSQAGFTLAPHVAPSLASAGAILPSTIIHPTDAPNGLQGNIVLRVADPAVARNTVAASAPLISSPAVTPAVTLAPTTNSVGAVLATILVDGGSQVIQVVPANTPVQGTPINQRTRPIENKLPNCTPIRPKPATPPSSNVTLAAKDLQQIQAIIRNTQQTSTNSPMLGLQALQQVQRQLNSSTQQPPPVNLLTQATPEKQSFAPLISSQIAATSPSIVASSISEPVGLKHDLQTNPSTAGVKAQSPAAHVIAGV